MVGLWDTWAGGIPLQVGATWVGWDLEDAEAAGVVWLFTHLQIELSCCCAAGEVRQPEVYISCCWRAMMSLCWRGGRLCVCGWWLAV